MAPHVPFYSLSLKHPTQQHMIQCYVSYTLLLINTALLTLLSDNHILFRLGFGTKNKRTWKSDDNVNDTGEADDIGNFHLFGLFPVASSLENTRSDHPIFLGNCRSSYSSKPVSPFISLNHAFHFVAPIHTPLSFVRQLTTKKVKPSGVGDPEFFEAFTTLLEQGPWISGHQCKQAQVTFRAQKFLANSEPRMREGTGLGLNFFILLLSTTNMTQTQSVY